MASEREEPTFEQFAADMREIARSTNNPDAVAFCERVLAATPSEAQPMSETRKDETEFVCCNVFRPCYGPSCKFHADNLNRAAPAAPAPRVPEGSEPTDAMVEAAIHAPECEMWTGTNDHDVACCPDCTRNALRAALSAEPGGRT